MGRDGGTRAHLRLRRPHRRGPGVRPAGPRDRWSVDAPILVLVGENSEQFFLDGAHALAEILPAVTVETLPGQDHGAFWLAPDAVAESVQAFLTR